MTKIPVFGWLIRIEGSSYKLQKTRVANLYDGRVFEYENPLKRRLVGARMIVVPQFSHRLHLSFRRLDVLATHPYLKPASSQNPTPNSRNFKNITSPVESALETTSSFRNIILTMYSSGPGVCSVQGSSPREMCLTSLSTSLSINL